MKQIVKAFAASALLLGGASLAMAQGPGSSPGGDPKSPSRDAGPMPDGDKKTAPERSPDSKDRPAKRDDAGKDDSRAGRDRGDDKKSATPADRKSPKDSTASDRDGDKSGRKSTDTRRKDETPKASAPSDDKSDRKATDTRRKDETPKASAPDKDRTGKAAKTGDDDKKGTQLSEQKRTTVHERLSRDRKSHVTNVRFTVSVGATVPRNVEVYELPADIIEIVPEYRSYRYVWVEDDIVIIDPARYVVIAVVSGGSRSASAGGARLMLTDAERRIISRHVSSSGHVVRERIEIGGRIPESIELMAFPDVVITEVPRLREYRYVFVGDDIAIVDPDDTTVLLKIDD